VAGLVSGKRGRPGNHQLSAGKAQRGLAVNRECSPDFGADAGLREAAGVSRFRSGGRDGAHADAGSRVVDPAQGACA
jgi:hypothetical protein